MVSLNVWNFNALAFCVDLGAFWFETTKRGILTQQWLLGFVGAVGTRPKHPLIRHGPVKALIIARAVMVNETPSFLFRGRVGLSFHKNTLFHAFKVTWVLA